MWDGTLEYVCLTNNPKYFDGGPIPCWQNIDHTHLQSWFLSSFRPSCICYSFSFLGAKTQVWLDLGFFWGPTYGSEAQWSSFPPVAEVTFTKFHSLMSIYLASSAFGILVKILCQSLFGLVLLCSHAYHICIFNLNFYIPATLYALCPQSFMTFLVTGSLYLKFSLSTLHPSSFGWCLYKLQI